MRSSGCSCPGSQALVVSFVPQFPVVIAVMRGAVRCVGEAGKRINRCLRVFKGGCHITMQCASLAGSAKSITIIFLATSIEVPGRLTVYGSRSSLGS